MPTATLADRTIVSISGEDAAPFLQNLITTDLDALDPGEAAPGALLTPQGKILFDFLISRAGAGFELECRKDIAADFIRRLMLYRLRARVEISEADRTIVAVSWGADSDASGGLSDKRFVANAVKRRHAAAGPGESASPEDWHGFRIGQGVGESGDDFSLGDAFPHDVLFDRNGGVSFAKGCFVGQEVVSRMQHRGTARRRLLIARGKSALPAPGAEINAGGRTIGTLGSVAGEYGLAMVRIDRAAAAMAGGVAILAGETELALDIPAWAGIEFPTSDAPADAG